MPLLIMKLAIEAATTATASPVSTRLFTVMTSDAVEGTTFTIDTAEFFDDTGNTPAELPALNPANSTIKLYINGVMQMDGIYTYTSGAAGTGNLTVTVPAQGSILEGSPIVLEIVNYNPTAATEITT